MRPSNLHFTSVEFEHRKSATLAAMKLREFDAMVLFRQESLFWLTGYDTFGYVYFQCGLLTADGRLALLTRAPDLLQARFTSIIDDIRIWADGDSADPYRQAADLMAEYGCLGQRIGVEWDAYGMTARQGHLFGTALDSKFNCVDASTLISRLRVTKSNAELGYVRRAAQLADDAFAAGLAATRPGAFEGDILADMHGAVFRGGGDDPANEFIIGSGAGALMCRYYSGRRHLDPQDQLTLEFAGTYRHYHACLMRTVLVGPPDPRLVAMHAACADALHAAEVELRPGERAGDAFDAQARVLDAAGYRDQRLNACGYSLGTTFAPNWMDWPMLYAGQDLVLAPGMVFFVHIILFDPVQGLAMTLGRTSVVNETSAEPLSTASLELPLR